MPSKTDHELLTNIIRALHLRIDDLQNRHTLQVQYKGESNEDGHFHGNGKYVDDSGTTYDGGWQNGNRHGSGTQTFVNGTKYTGTWENNRKVGLGHGHELYGDGSTFDGEFLNGQKYNGTQKYPDGSEYTGQWKNNLFHGTGKFTKDGRTIYEGEFKLGRKDGIGTRTYRNGDSYYGEWRDGQRNGQGTFTLYNAYYYTGGWLNNQRSGHGSTHWLDPDGFEYKGELLDGKKHGYGTKTDLDGTYTGAWRYNKRHGHSWQIHKHGRQRVHWCMDKQCVGGRHLHWCVGERQKTWAWHIYVRGRQNGRSRMGQRPESGAVTHNSANSV